MWFNAPDAFTEDISVYFLEAIFLNDIYNWKDCIRKLVMTRKQKFSAAFLLRERISQLRVGRNIKGRKRYEVIGNLQLVPVKHPQTSYHDGFFLKNFAKIRLRRTLTNGQDRLLSVLQRSVLLADSKVLNSLILSRF